VLPEICGETLYGEVDLGKGLEGVPVHRDGVVGKLFYVTD
jgi:hypothetical protein